MQVSGYLVWARLHALQLVGLGRSPVRTKFGRGSMMTDHGRATRDVGRWFWRSGAPRAAGEVCYTFPTNSPAIAAHSVLSVTSGAGIFRPARAYQ